MKTIGNILWHFPLFGWVQALSFIVLGFILKLLVVTAPIGNGLMELGKLLLWPFGRDFIKEPKKAEATAWDQYAKIVRIAWFPIGAFFAFFGLMYTIGAALSIVLLPLAVIQWKIVKGIFNPVGIKVVDGAVIEELKRQKAQEYIAENMA